MPYRRNNRSIMQSLDELADLRGKNIRDLTDREKLRFMTHVIPRSITHTNGYSEVIRAMKPGHKCSKEGCGYSCFQKVKAGTFDILLADMLKEN